MRFKKQFGAAVLAVSMLAGMFAGTAGTATEVYGKVSEDQRAYLTKDLQFLNHLEEESLVRVTVEEKQAEEMLALIKDITKDAKTDYEQAKCIFQWIGENVMYESDPSISISVNPYDVFTNKKAVCGGYANLFKEMLNLIDIPAVVMVGYYQGMGHAWSAVYADDRWMYCDSTGGAVFDADPAAFSYYYQTNEISDAYAAVGDTLIGYYFGISVIGAKEGVTDVVVPETFRDMQVESVSYQLFAKKYGVKSVTVGANVEQIGENGKSIESDILEAIHVKEGNKQYTSSDGVLFNGDKSCLFVYPCGKKDETYQIPKETAGFLDEKNMFLNDYLMELEVEEGNPYYSAYDGALYNKEQTELLFVPIARTVVEIPKNAEISYTAFANADLSKLTIRGEKGSPAEAFADANGIPFEDVNEKPSPEPVLHFEDVETDDYYYDPVCWAVRQGVTTGWTEKLFAPHMECTRAQFVTFLWRAMGKPEPSLLENPFLDMDEEDYYYDAVLWAVENGITSGMTETMFAPDEKCQRAQIVTFLWRMEESPKVEDSNPFIDVKSESYYYDAVLWAVNQGITTGWTENTFAPKMNCTRAQSVTFLYRDLNTSLF